MRPRLRSLSLLAFLVLLAPVALAATFIVTSTADAGPGTLRQAIADANATAAHDTIVFAIAGGGVHVIAPLSELPGIVAPLTIDGTTQPGYAGTPLIHLSGSGAFHGLRLIGGSSGSAVRGLVVGGFWEDIVIDGSDGNTIAANYLGTNAAGNAQAPPLGQVFIRGINNVLSGNLIHTRVQIYSGSGTQILDNRIGTNAAGTAKVGPNAAQVFTDDQSHDVRIAGNVIYGNITLFGGNNGVIENNRIGTDVTGTVALGAEFNVNDVLLKGNNHRLGGPLPSQRNIIVGKVFFYEGEGSSVLGNYIGVAADGETRLFANTVVGLYPDFGGRNVRIGDVTAGSGNVIDGYVRVPSTSNGVAVRGNTFLRTAPSGAISLDPYGPNDPGDADTGANNQQNFPVLEAVTTGNATQVAGTLDSTPSTTFAIDIYSSSRCTSAGNRIDYIGSTTVTTDATGHGTFSFTAPAALAFLSATATDPGGNTSELSACMAASHAEIPALSLTMMVLLGLSLSVVGLAALRR